MAVVDRKQRVEVYKKLSTNWSDEPIIIDEAFNVSVTSGIGNRKDTLTFNVGNIDGKYSVQKFSGDASTTIFTLGLAPVPTEYINIGEDFKLYVDDVLKSNGTDYTIAGGSVITFTSAPSIGIDNIQANFKVLDDDDQVRVYFWQDSEFEALTDEQKADALKIEGTITKAGVKISSKKNTLSITAVSSLEELFNGLVIIRNQTKTTPDAIIRSVLAEINNINPNRHIYGATTAEWTALGNNTTKRGTTGSFPDVQYSSSYKRAMEIIEEVSSDKFTEDGQYIYNIETDYSTGSRNFIWRHKDPIPDTSTEIDENTNYQDIKVERKIDGVVNAVIYNVGQDALGRSREYLNFNPIAQSKSGTKWKYVTKTNNILPNLIAGEIEGTKSGTPNTVYFPKDSGSNVIQRYPDTGSFNNVGGQWEFQFYDRDETTGSIKSNFATATDKESYNKALLLEAEWLGKKITDRIIDLYSNPKFSVTMTTNDNLGLISGSVYNFTVLDFSLDTKPLRLIQQTNELFYDTYEFLEDEQTVILQE